MIYELVAAAQRGAPLYAVVTVGLIVGALIFAIDLWMVRRMEAATLRKLESASSAPTAGSGVTKLDMVEREALEVAFNWLRRPYMALGAGLLVFFVILAVVSALNGSSDTALSSLVLVGLIASIVFGLWRGGQLQSLDKIEQEEGARRALTRLFAFTLAYYSLIAIAALLTKSGVAMSAALLAVGSLFLLWRRPALRS